MNEHHPSEKKASKGCGTVGAKSWQFDFWKWAKIPSGRFFPPQRMMIIPSLHFSRISTDTTSLGCLIDRHISCGKGCRLTIGVVRTSSNLIDREMSVASTSRAQN
jgi:hypothetical protein